MNNYFFLKTFDNFNKKLYLRFRPEDQYCNAATAEAHPTVGLLLRVRRRKPLPKPKVMKRKERKEPEVQIVDLEAEESADGTTGSRTKTVVIDGVSWTKEQMLKEDRRLMKEADEQSQVMMKQWNFRSDRDSDQYYVNIPADHNPEVEPKLHLEALGIVYRSYKFEG